MATMKAGDRVGTYQLQKLLGAGSFGEVWSATHPTLGSQVAVKVLTVQGERTARTFLSARSRFLNEAQMVAQLQGELGIVGVLDQGTIELPGHLADGLPYYAMEFLDGESLGARLGRERVLPLGLAAQIAQQMAQALAAAHKKGIVHRDLKPDNVMLVHDSAVPGGIRAKVCDFGIAKLIHQSQGTQGPMGTPIYMPPEQWRGAADADSRSDVYSLGCILYEMVCGRTPFVCSSQVAYMTAHLTEAPPRPRDLDRSLPAQVEALLLEMLAKDSKKRPPSMEAVATRLGPIVDRALARTLPDKAETREVTQGWRPWRVVLALLGATVVVLAVTGLVWRRGTTNPWVRISPPANPLFLGVTAARSGVDGKIPDAVSGFRPGLVKAPDYAYDIQEHEVTWAEYEAWAKRAERPALPRPTWVDDAERLPVAGVSWQDSQSYCESVGGSLPTEAEWEYAARGAAGRAAPWGDERLDRRLTHAFQPDGATPAPIRSKAQDRTPGAAGTAVFDLIGNVREWTRDLWRDELTGRSEAWVDEQQYHAVRGLPLVAPAQEPLPEEPAAYRSRLCAACLKENQEAAAKLGADIGLRCARSAP